MNPSAYTRSPPTDCRSQREQKKPRPKCIKKLFFFRDFEFVKIVLNGEASTTATELGQPDEHDFPVNVVYFNLYHPYQFNCTMSGVTSYKWTRNGTAVTGSEEKGPKLVEDGAILALSRMHESDHGNYTCRADGKLVVAWEARGRPLARVPFDTNVVEGQTVTITCKLIGRPYTNVTWTYRRSGEENATAIEVGAADGRFSAKDSAAGVPGGELQLRAAELGDAGEYACVPEHGTPAATTLRVKDVYAALWPFLGICLEVFILCAIILVYEKRRTKPELDDSDADTHDQ